MELSGPKMERSAPKMELSGPKMERSGPEMGRSGPKMERSGPEMELSAPKMELSGPKMERRGPKTGCQENYFVQTCRLKSPKKASFALFGLLIFVIGFNFKPSGIFLKVAIDLCYLLKIFGATFNQQLQKRAFCSCSICE